MLQIVLIGLGAGAASAFLFASVARGSPLAFLLANFAQLPIMIAAVGWTHLAAIAAVLFASAGLALAFGGSVAFAFLLVDRPAGLVDRLSGAARAPGVRARARPMSNGIRSAASWCGPRSRPAAW